MGRITVFFLLLGLFSVRSYGQIAPRVPGLERDSVYMSLLADENKLQQSQDSLQNLIRESRSLLSSAASDQRESFSNKILNLEGQLFDVRNRLGIITTQLNTIEQEFIINNLNNENTRPQTTVTDVISSSNLLRMAFIRDNISPQDMQIISRSAETGANIKALAAEYGTLYTGLKELRAQYMAAPTPGEADSLRQVSLQHKQQLSRVESQVRQQWQPVYDTKMENYRGMLDYLNASYDVLDPLTEQSRELRNREADASGKFESVDLAIYPWQQKLILSYEIALAQELKAPKALDSLKRVLAAVTEAPYEFPLQDFPEREFIEYTGITVGGAGIHSTRNPVPEHETPRISTVYKIQLGTYAKAPALSVFKNVHPLSYEERPDGQIAYYAGAYSSYSHTQDDFERLRKLGFKPSVVGWSGGKRIADAVTASGTELIYKIEFPSLTDSIRGIIEQYASGKEISRVDNEQGQTVFSLGSFAEKEEAMEIAEKMGENAKIVAIPR